ncbi:MAG: hypothetical protein GXO48_02690 [Chlorobi bacterium]|nr:hypothetical protein [Chlorobiota bacterium]
MRKLQLFLVTLGIVATVSSCRKDKDLTGHGAIALKVTYSVDGESLQMDEMKYVNEAGNVYSVTRLQYYISHIELFNRDYGWTLIDTFFLFDADKYPSQMVTVANVPLRYYDSIRFYIGLPPNLNHHDSLPNTLEHQEMAWPEMMGGGFHFLKLEGKFKETDTSSTILGYAMHLGTNVALVTVRLPVQMDLSGKAIVQLELDMNINEWFRNPYTYNLAEEPYIMGDTVRMQIIARNGQDVFTVVGIK